MKTQYEVIQRDKETGITIILWNNKKMYFKDVASVKLRINELRLRYPKDRARFEYTIRKREVTEWEEVETL